MPTQNEIVEAVSKSLQSKDLTPQAVMVLQRATGKVLDRIKQNVDSQIKEDSSPIVEEFVKNLSAKLSAMSQQWSDGVKNDLVVFPEGTRYIHRDGTRTTIVVEQAPQTRTLKINGKQYHLGLPYVQFIIPLQNHEANQGYFVTCTKKPLSDLDKPLNHLPFTNVDASHKICVGNGSHGIQVPKNSSVNDTVTAMIGAFWQSEFTGDLHDYFTKFKIANFPGNDAVALDKWAAATKKDSLFAISKETKYEPGATLRRFLTPDNNSQNGSASIVTKMKQEILTAVGSIGGDIQSLLTSVDLKTENRDKVHLETLSGVFKEIIIQAYTELWEYLQKQLADEKKKLMEEMQTAAAKLKNDFMYTMNQENKKRTTW